MKSKKFFEKISLLNAEIDVKNKLIGQLLHIITENKIQLPVYIIKILEGLYSMQKIEHTHVPYDSTKKH